ncbi:MAG TPA: FG-GAP-like repeat-containing protein [Kofleriaceae bacterium]
MNTTIRHSGRILGLVFALGSIPHTGCGTELSADAQTSAVTSNPVIARTRPDGTPAYYRRECAPSGVAGNADCMLLKLTDAQGNSLAPGVRPDGSPSGLHPNELQAAYNIATWGGLGVTVAIVDAFDNPNAEADLQVYRTQFGLGACTTRNGCFRKVNQDGNASPLPPGRADWGLEIALDLDAVSAACPSCKLLLVEANTSGSSDLLAAERTAVNLGATIVSNSWGRDEFDGEASDSINWNFPGVSVLFASGDSGYTHQVYPAASQYVTAVGGTSLFTWTSARNWSETVWDGAGSGCSQFIAKPSWQHDAGCANRTVADVSAVADPLTGLAVYDTYLVGGWTVVGGTSLATPVVAGIYATSGMAGAGPSLPYTVNAFYDVTVGANGSCTDYLCNGALGYDGPTGNGSPSGTLFLHPPDPSAIVGGGVSGDFDGDGKDDVMVLYDNGNASAALWVFPGTTGQTDGSTAPYRVWFAPGPNAFDANRAKVAAGDFDGDGKTDVLALYDYGNTSAALFVFPGVASHAENASVPYKVWSVQGPNAFDVGRAKISAADFNGDGKTDLLALYDYGNTSAGLFVFPGVASHTENASLPYRIWFVPGPNAFDVRRAKVSAGDFNGDQKADLLALYDYGNTSAGLFVFPGVASHVENASQPSRVWHVLGPNAFDVSRTKITAGDFNHNGKKDVMALYDYGSGSAGLFVFPGTAGTTDTSSLPYRVWNPGPGSFDLRFARVP